MFRNIDQTANRLNISITVSNTQRHVSGPITNVEIHTNEDSMKKMVHVSYKGQP